MNQVKYRSVILGSLVALAVLSVKANAQTVESAWGDLGYSEKSPEVEELPTSLTLNEGAPIASPAEPAVEPVRQPRVDLVQATPVKESPPSRSFTQVSTVQNTFGVETEEKPSLQIYFSPFAGTSSVMGNDTADNNPQFAIGASLGLLVSSNMLLELSYTHAEQNFSNPRINTTQGVFVSGDANVFALKQNALDAGVKLFILGRESRFRPFLGGGVGYTRASLNYTSAYQQALGNQPAYANEFKINQMQGFGELGTEFAFTRNVVASASFKVNGVLSSNTSGDTAPMSYDPSKLDVGNSLSRTASYVLAAGVGIYF